MKRKVVHLINGLGKGGAETMLYHIVKFRTENSPQYSIVSLGLSHYYEKLMIQQGVDLIELDIKKHPITSIRKLKNSLKNADTLCCWMYISNLIGYIAGRKHVEQLIWCIRHSDLTKKINSRKTILINKVCAKLSRRVDVVAYNGFKAMNVHRELGYCPIAECVLENGIDLMEYYHDYDMRMKIRQNLAIESNDKVVLSVTRDNPIKDNPTFIRAFAHLRNEMGDVKAIMCGAGISENNVSLSDLCKTNGLTIGEDIYLLGFRDEINELLNAADLFVLHSAGEAFPNVVIQAMGSGTVVVSTDVGDVRNILECSENIVDSGDYIELSKKMLGALNMNSEEKQKIIKKNRKIVEQKYNILSVVKKYEELYAS